MSTFIVSSIVTASILLGCSGHGLQDLADETFNDKSQEHHENKSASSKSLEQAETVSDEKKVSPSSDPALNSISPSKTASSDNGTMQKSLDSWIKEEWTPMMEKNESIKKVDDDEDRPFTLQKYVDKAGVYMEDKPKDSEPSHKEQMDTLPVIGK